MGASIKDSFIKNESPRKNMAQMIKLTPIQLDKLKVNQSFNIDQGGECNYPIPDDPINEDDEVNQFGFTFRDECDNNQEMNKTNQEEQIYHEEIDFDD